MTITMLQPRAIEKPWGCTGLAAPYDAGDAGARIGEIWYETPAGHDTSLLVKALFTSDRLSVQVHPSDARAAEIGLARGKDEAWYVLAAEPDARIGVGITAPIDAEALRRAAEDGSIVDLMEWRRVTAGDVLYAPGGTIHALGAGLQLIEIQQALDLTYRLYDYGRPRELHLDEGMAASVIAPFGPAPTATTIGDHRRVRSEGGKFVLEEISGPFHGTLSPADGRPAWLIMLAGSGRIDGRPLAPGAAWLCDAPAPIEADAATHLLVAYPGGTVHAGLL